MFNNVLVGVDGSPRGRDAIALAARLTDDDGKLTLAHVRNAELNPFETATPGLVTEDREASENLLVKESETAGVSAELVSVVAMDAGRGLHLRAEEQHADLLVVGSSSHGALGRAMLGDDTRAALNGAPCAVAIAAVGYSEHPSPIADVGVAYNESPESKQGLALARELAATTRAKVYALEVVSIPTYAFIGMSPPLLGETVDAMLREATARMGALSGVDGEELAQFGDAVDILVVGSRSYGPVRRLVLGSTSNYLERHARCSLLVLPRAGAVGAEAAASTGAQAENVIA
jgi:nucleotide-binding universal stress UspA family protein